MKSSIERSFIKNKEKNPPCSSYLCFAHAIKDEGFKRESIRHWFLKLVDKDDYAKNETFELLGFLSHLSDPLCDRQK